MPRFNILLVDPEPSAIDPLACWLTDRTHVVQRVNDLASALAAIQMDRFDVVFMTSRLDLHEVLGWLRGKRSILESRTVATLVGIGDTVSTPDLVGTGAVEVVHQPCSFEEIEARCFLARRRLDVGSSGLLSQRDRETRTCTDRDVNDLGEERASPAVSIQLGSPEVTLEEIAKAHVLGVLEQERGNKARTARKLGIHRRKLYRLLKRFESKEEEDVVL